MASYFGNTSIRDSLHGRLLASSLVDDRVSFRYNQENCDKVPLFRPHHRDQRELRQILSPQRYLR